MLRRSVVGLVAPLLYLAPVFGQDPMQFHVRQLNVVAEDSKVRVLRYAPHKGDKTPMHSHPYYVVYVIKGGKVRFTLPDGTTRDTTLNTGETLLRPPVTHADEALDDDIEFLLVEIKE
jgi:quercetin dioxygenase-like cupin family protein